MGERGNRPPFELKREYLTNPVQGYYFTHSYDRARNSLIAFLERWQQGSFSIHCGFRCYGVHNGQEQFIHLSPLTQTVSNQDPNRDEIIENMLDSAGDADRIEGLAGSGWTVDINVKIWFLSIMQNTERNINIDAIRGGAEEPLQEVAVTNDPLGSSSFYQCLGTAIHWDSTPLKVNENGNAQKMLKLKSYKYHNLKCEVEDIIRKWINPITRQNPTHSTAKGIIEKLPFPIAVITLRGAALYANQPYDKIRIWLVAREDETWGWIPNSQMPDFYRCRRDMNKRVVPGIEPEIVDRLPQSTHIELRNLPETKHRLVMYADYEAVVPRDGQAHFPSGVGALALDGDTVFATATITKDNVNERFIEFIESTLERWNAPNQDETDAKYRCCDNPCSRGKIVRRSYVDGKYRMYHIRCWLDKTTEYMFVYFHNFKGYDSHHLLAKFIKEFQNHTVMARTFEKIEQLGGCSKMKEHCSDFLKVQFRDTMAHFDPAARSLALIAKTIDNWTFVPEEYRSGKDYFPYEWFDDINKLDGPIPPEEDWKLEFFPEHKVDYVYIIEQCLIHDFNTFRDWHDFYMMKDVYILAQAFNNYRDGVLSGEGVDPVYFVGAPGLTWWLAMRQENTKPIRLCMDLNIQKDIMANIRGGISQCFKRYSEGPYIMYLDVNSLYSYCMMENLPCAYVTTLYNVPDDWVTTYGSWSDEYCLFIKCDLDFDPEWRTKYWWIAEFPPVPHKFADRLCTTFHKKEDYLVDSRLLAFYMRNGIVVTKYHYAYKFQCRPVFKKYVEENIRKRREHLDDPVKKTLYKLLNNSLYGKTCENVTKYRSFSIDPLDEAQDGITQTNPVVRRKRGKVLQHMVIYDTVYSEYEKRDVVYNKPNHIGFGVLEKAKYEVYDFWYQIKKQFGDAVNILYTDTDSIIMEFNTVLHPMEELRLANPELYYQYLDYGHTGEHVKKKAGLWSDDLEGKIAEKFVGLKAKTYALKLSDGNEKMKNKGIPMKAHYIETPFRPTKDRICFDDYVKCLNEDVEVKVRMFQMMSVQHNVMSKRLLKRALTSTDNKRHVLADGIHTVPWGPEYEPPNKLVRLP